MKPFDHLLELAGIQPSYQDIWGDKHHIPVETGRLILEALGLPATTPDDIRRSIAHLEAERAKPLPDSLPIPLERAQVIHCTQQGRWQVELENGSQQEGEITNGEIHLPPLPMGYHALKVKDAECFLIVHPPKCWIPGDMAEGRRVWGLAAQLYGIRSARNWGIGDYGDLSELAQRAAGIGADVIGLNPLHAMFPENPHRFSPYAPSSRLWLNTVYLDVTAIAGFESEHVQNLLDDDFHHRLKTARQAELVDYPLVASLKRPVLEALFEQFYADGDAQGLTDFIQEGGDLLYQQALFAVLSEHFASRKEPKWNWQEWPEEYKEPGTTAVRQFADAHKKRIRFFQWLQFEADRQLGSAQHTAREAGMHLGLYRDLAVGPDTGGAENWMDPARFIHGVSIGAPPDEYNLKGQDWGLPPLNPMELRRRRFSPFIELVRANMRHAQALRIDHAFALSRLYLVPHGKNSAEGAYITFPFDALLAVLRVESHRQCCIVIGEDLGTFPPGYKEKAAEAGLFSYKVLYFERDENGDFLPPVDYPAHALATVSTHDLPTFEGWFEASDIDLRAGLDLYPTAKHEQNDRKGRQKDHQRLLDAFRQEKLKGEPGESAQRYLARSPALVTVTQLEDVLGLTEQANVPGTIDEHPNWRRRLPVALDGLFERSPLHKLAEHINVERERPACPQPLATYRLQLHAGFDFDAAIAILPYLRDLGISHVYASPIFTARPGSNHGYDVTDPTRINPELGGEEGFLRFSDALAANGLHLLLDFVPNHMAADWRNPWWWSVLAEGRDSPYAHFFDIDWQAANGHIILPVLGDDPEAIIQNGELALKQDDNGLYLAYYDHRFPLNSAHMPKGKKADLAALLDRQHYRLVYWRDAAKHINYRRFFEINDLGCLRMEDPAVFRAVHHRIFELIRDGRLQGLRIDHIDGLADPTAYLHRLEERLGRNFPVYVEKILGHDEELPQNWEVAGTTGYEAMNKLAGLFVPPSSETEMTALYQDFTGEETVFSTVLRQAKQQVLEESFRVELANLARLMQASAQKHGRKWPESVVKKALAAAIVAFPVYRSYITSLDFSQQDTDYIARAIDEAKTQNPDLPEDLWAFLKSLLALAFTPANNEDEAFVSRFQQLTSPAMAKGMEDTAFYRYFRLAALNEVGGEPGHFGTSPESFHRFCQTRPKRALTATATHDHKRGEDTRLHMALLAAKPGEWAKAVHRWREINTTLNEGVHPADEYLIYQTLVGFWPETFSPDDIRRLQDYMVKALREGKQRSHWLQPDEPYEQKICEFITRLLDHPPFLTAFTPFQETIAASARNSGYVQTALKLTMPGIPDIYQGCEWEDLSLVDPDNRRPVDYTARQAGLKNKPHAKQQLIHTLLQHRQQNPELYLKGDYTPLDAPQGMLAYLREHHGQQLLVIASLHGDADAAFPLPDKLAGQSWRDLLTGEPIPANGIPFNQNPIAILVNG